MPWYSSLFQEIYQSPIGLRILNALEKAVQENNFQAYAKLDLLVRQFERITTAPEKIDSSLIDSIGKIKNCLLEMNEPFSSEEEDLLNVILGRNGFLAD